MAPVTTVVDVTPLAGLSGRLPVRRRQIEATR
jgi:hypothetical protein